MHGQKNFSSLAIVCAALLGLVLGGCSGAPGPAAGPAKGTVAQAQGAQAGTVPSPAPTGALPTVLATTVAAAPTTRTTEPAARAAGAAPDRAASAAKVVRLNLGNGDVSTLDPAHAADIPSGVVVDETYVGLARVNAETNALEPGMAASWDVSPDGLVYTFHLRPGVPWVKFTGDRVAKVQSCPDAVGQNHDRLVTSQDFVYGILRALDPATASDYGHVLGSAIAGGADFNAGKITDTAKVGVEALDSATLKITVSEPAAYNPYLLSLWVGSAQPRWLIEGDACTKAQGDRWTEAGVYQSYGPYVLREWTHEARLTLVKNPFWPADIANIPAPKIDELAFRMLDDDAAFTEFEAGNLDAATVPPSAIERVKADPRLSGQLHFNPVPCTVYYGFNTQAPIVNDPDVRLALSLAVDRQSLVDNVVKGGQEPARWFAHPSLAAAPTQKDYPDLGVRYDPERARALLGRYLQAKGTTADRLDLTLAIGPDFVAPRVAAAIQEMWRTNLGLHVKIDTQDMKGHMQSIMNGPNAPAIWSLGWCADYPDANNFARDTVTKGGVINPGPGGLNWQNDDYEKLVNLAARETNPQKRTHLYAQAEDILVAKDAALLPLYWQAGVSITSPALTGPYRTFGAGRFELWDRSADGK